MSTPLLYRSHISSNRWSFGRLTTVELHLVWSILPLLDRCSAPATTADDGRWPQGEIRECREPVLKQYIGHAMNATMEAAPGASPTLRTRRWVCVACLAALGDGT